MTVEGFGAAYARAKELQAHAWSDELAELADDDSLDPQVRRVKFDIKKWLMSKQCFERSRSTRITADRVVLELEKLAFSNIFDLIELRSTARLISVCCAQLVTGPQRYTTSS